MFRMSNVSHNQCSAYKKAQIILERPLQPPPLGSCMIPIVENYLGFIKQRYVSSRYRLWFVEFN